MSVPEPTDQSTAGGDYTRRLERLEGSRWKQVLNVQAPYRHNLRSICRGRVLEVGCGIGRNLAHLDGSAVGVDHNPDSIRRARERGYEAYTTEEFLATDLAQPGTFDTLLVAHVLEHVDEDLGDQLLLDYAKYLRRPARLVLICPQERGFASDETHIRWVNEDELVAHTERLGARVDSVSSFPFPRVTGKAFRYNEFVLVGTLS